MYSSGSIANYVFDPTLVVQAGQWRLVVQDLPKQLPPSPRPLTVPTKATTQISLITATNSVSVPCAITAIDMTGNCTFLSSTASSPQTTRRLTRRRPLPRLRQPVYHVD